MAATSLAQWLLRLLDWMRALIRSVYSVTQFRPSFTAVQLFWQDHCTCRALWSALIGVPWILWTRITYLEQTEMIAAMYRLAERKRLIIASLWAPSCYWLTICLEVVVVGVYELKLPALYSFNYRFFIVVQLLTCTCFSSHVWACVSVMILGTIFSTNFFATLSYHCNIMIVKL